jgi:3-methyladenine DNA glycosylase AlkD
VSSVHLADELTARLREHGSPARAVSERAYLKSSYEHFGVSVPVGRQVVKRFAREHSELDQRRGVLAVVAELWTQPVYERRRAGLELLMLRSSMLTVSDLAFVERLLRESRTWALVDGLAGDVAGRLVAAHESDPTVDARLDGWAADQDFWVRRSALLAHLIGLKSGRGFDRFCRYADAMLEESEFFIRKAIGWVLREEGARRPEEVTAWLLPRATRCSGVTLREAVKHLPPEQVAVIRAAAA